MRLSRFTLSSGGGLLFPWLRLAVPLFFLISSYLFFTRYDTLDDSGSKRVRLTKFVKRNMQLYFFWLVVLLFPTLVIRRAWFADGILFGLLQFVRGFFFGSTFVASWYIMATVIAVLGIAFLSRKLSNGILMAVFTVGYAFATLSSNYGNLFLGVPELVDSYATLSTVFGVPYNNFVVGLFWVQMGKMFADARVRDGSVPDRRPALVYTVVGLVLLGFEQVIIDVTGASFTNDCYFALILAVPGIFALILRWNMSTSHAKEMRAVSTITYCFHGTCARVLGFVLGYFGFVDPGFIVFVITLALSWFVCWAILRLEKRPHLGILRYSH